MPDLRYWLLQEFRQILGQYTDIPEENRSKFDVRDGGVSGEHLQ